MSIDTSREAVERLLMLMPICKKPCRNGGSQDACVCGVARDTMRALLRERNEAQADAARYLADANKSAAALLRSDIAAILRGEAIAVQVASGQSVGEPRGCPTPGACSCVGAAEAAGGAA